MDNRGLVVGKVFNTNGKRANNAVVHLSKIIGGSGLISAKKYYAQTNSKGEYELGFLWDDWDGFSNDLTVLSIGIGAWTEENSNNTSRVRARSYSEVRGYVIRDNMQAMGAYTNTFSSMPEIADSAISLAQTLVHYENLVPFWKATNLASTQCWLIVARADIYLH